MLANLKSSTNYVIMSCGIATYYNSTDPNLMPRSDEENYVDQMAC